MSRKARRELDTELHIYRIPPDAGGELPAKEIVGSKAYNLMRMARRGLPVPPGFVLGTELCRDYLKRGESALAGIDRLLLSELEFLTAKTGRRVGDARRPLLLSVRSGAVVSMPGMMETVLNIGMTDAAARGVTRMTGNPRLAADCSRRLVAQFAEVVNDIPPDGFDQLIRKKLDEQQVLSIADIDTDGLCALSDDYRTYYLERFGEPFPETPMAQLTSAVGAVVKSWMSDRAKAYRKMNAIPESIGTAVLVQQMVFGNAGPTSGSGVGFTRNPSDGSKGLYVDFLANAQGEDVVSGRFVVAGTAELQRDLPNIYHDLSGIAETLEQEFGDMQDFEFTVEDGRLYMLQARSGKRTPLAALQIATDLVAEGKIDKKAAKALLGNVDIDAIETLSIIVPEHVKPVATAIPASVGAVSGIAVFDPERVALYKAKGLPLILLRSTTETSDIKALADAVALVTSQGARTSHAAVVARQLGRVCLVGCQSLNIDKSLRAGSFGAVKVEEGDLLTLDAARGEIFLGELPIKRVKPEALISVARSWNSSEPKAMSRT